MTLVPVQLVHHIYVSELWVTLDLARDRLLIAVKESSLSNVTAHSCVKSTRGWE